MQVADRIQEVRRELPEGVTLCAVSKYHPIEAVKEAYEAGQRIFGESREQEVRLKWEALPKDIEWHFIGHLQTNKVKYIAPFVSLIQSVDSERLLDEIQKQAAKNSRVIDVLLEVHIAQEESKSGFNPDELTDLLASVNIGQRWPNVNLKGIMAMATFTDDENQIRNEFHSLMTCYRQLLDGPLAQQGITAEQFVIRSFGMSEDYKIAVAEGSNMVRIGSHIFGEREY
ncbi:MAG: YggS family pyridoxal phosphate-dependent enzyme [Bacteroidales bacterium]|nr:YggS family pyridoxal phosphate-dependent enzyme [Bacteroidales bacterium]